MPPNEEKLELITQAIQKLIADKKSGFDGDGDGDEILLSRLLSEVRDEAAAAEKSTTEEIIKEIKTLKRQNRITHLLLSVMIALTVAWQLSEVSLILKIKNGLTLNLTNPFRSLHNIFSAMAKAKPPKIADNEDNTSSTDEDAATLQIPDLHLPHIDIPGLPSSI